MSTEVIESGPFTSLEQPMLASDSRGRAQVHGFGVYSDRRGRSRRRLRRFRICSRRSSRPAGSCWSQAVVGWWLARQLSDAVEPIDVTRSAGRLARIAIDGVRLASPLDSFGGLTVSAFVAYWLRARFDALRRAIADASPSVADGVVPGRPCSPTGSACCARWSSPTCRPTCCSSPWRSRPTWPRPSCCWPRTALSQMDVPTWQAYVMALVDPDERNPLRRRTPTQPDT